MKKTLLLLTILLAGCATNPEPWKQTEQDSTLNVAPVDTAIVTQVHILTREEVMKDQTETNAICDKDEQSHDCVLAREKMSITYSTFDLQQQQAEQERFQKAAEGSKTPQQKWQDQILDESK